MQLTNKEKNEKVHILLRKMREAAELTMRQVGAMVGVSHVTISQFENGKLSLPEYRIEQLIKAYGLTTDDFNKILGRAPIVDFKDDCRAMIDRMGDEELAVLRNLLKLICNNGEARTVAVATAKMSQIRTNKQFNIAQ